MWRLNNLYTQLDQQLEAFGVHKVETIGDCYVVAAGLKLGSDEELNNEERGQSDTVQRQSHVARHAE